MTNPSQPCATCSEIQAHEFHRHDPHGYDRGTEFDCNYDADWLGEETGYIGSCDHHEYVPGCECADRGKCSYCVERAVLQADMMERSN